jgi:hypothetical protein
MLQQPQEERSLAMASNFLVAAEKYILRGCDDDNTMEIKSQPSNLGNFAAAN